MSKLITGKDGTTRRMAPPCSSCVFIGQYLKYDIFNHDDKLLYAFEIQSRTEQGNAVDIANLKLGYYNDNTDALTLAMIKLYKSDDYEDTSI